MMARTGLWYGEADMNTGRRTATIYGALHAFLPTVFVLNGDLDRAKRLQDSGFAMWNLYGIEPEELARLQHDEALQLRLPAAAGDRRIGVLSFSRDEGSEIPLDMGQTLSFRPHLATAA